MLRGRKTNAAIVALLVPDSIHGHTYRGPKNFLVFATRMEQLFAVFVGLKTWSSYFEGLCLLLYLYGIQSVSFMSEAWMPCLIRMAPALRPG